MEGQSTRSHPASPSGPKGARSDSGEPHNDDVAARAGRLGRLGHVAARYFGGLAAGKLSTRWYQSTAIPGKPAYEGSQRTLKALGAGQRPPNVVVFHSSRADVTTSAAVRAAMARVAKANPRALTSSYYWVAHAGGSRRPAG